MIHAHCFEITLNGSPCPMICQRPRLPRSSLTFAQMNALPDYQLTGDILPGDYQLYVYA